MKRPRRQSRPGARGLVGFLVLGAIALVAVLAAGAQFMRLLDSEREMDAVVREDAMWAVFQTDRHVRELLAQARLIAETGETGRHDELMQSYDILYSRVTLLERGTFLLDLSSDRRLSAAARELAGFVLDLAPRFDALDSAAPDYRDKVAALAADLGPWRVFSNDLLLRANADTNAMRVAERAVRAEIQDRLAWLALVLILAFVGILALLMLQLRRLERSNRRMAILQEGSRRRAHRAQAASKAKSAFLATMSHEIRTPLNGIIGSAELLALQPMTEDVTRRLGTITAQAFLLRDLIDGILDFSRLEAGVIEVGQTETDLGELARQLADAFAQQAEAAGLELGIALPPARVRVNQARLRQVLVNLIGNALKFTHRGRVQVRGTLPRPDLLRVEVQDDGIGIERAAIPALFREFSQLDSSHARSYGGSGLGLAICRRIVEGLGGQIGVQSEPGQGSLFWFELPVQAVDPVPEPRIGTPAQAPAGQGRRLSVLVAEDNEVNLGVIGGMLRHLGHEVHVARNGHQAVEMCHSLCPDLVLMDVQMPEMDGIEATRQIRLVQPDLPIVGVTANAFAADRRACLAAGMSDFLPKPITTRALVEAIGRLTAAGTPMAPVASPAETRPAVAAPETSPAADGNGQLADLVEALGPEIVAQLVDRFLGELDDLRINLNAPIAAGAPAVGAARTQDEVLHSFKGAALTLGMTGAGLRAQDLRGCLPVGPDEIEALIALAGAEASQARRLLTEWSA